MMVPELQSLLKVPPIANKVSRYVYTGNQELVESYLKSFNHNYADHRMIERIESLHKNQSKMSQCDIVDDLTRWDSDQGRAMSMAENKVTNNPKKYTWSLALRNAAIVRKYSKLRLREAKANFNYRKYLLAAETSTAGPDFLSPDNWCTTLHQTNKHPTDRCYPSVLMSLTICDRSSTAKIRVTSTGLL